MGPGMGLIAGTPFVVALIALIILFRRDRLRPPDQPRPRRFVIYRVVAVAMVLTVGMMVAQLLVNIVTGPHRGLG